MGIRTVPIVKASIIVTDASGDFYSPTSIHHKAWTVGLFINLLFFDLGDDLLLHAEIAARASWPRSVLVCMLHLVVVFSHPLMLFRVLRGIQSLSFSWATLIVEGHHFVVVRREQKDQCPTGGQSPFCTVCSSPFFPCASLLV